MERFSKNKAQKAKLAFTLIVLGACCLMLSAQFKPVENKKTDLNIAIFAFLPDAANAIERLEETFEHAHPNIDLDIELWDPYSDSKSDDGIEQIQNFDVVEIDLCRIDELTNNKFGGIDELPALLRPKSEDYIAGAKRLVETDMNKYIIPHWVCGNFLIFNSQNTTLKNAKTFNEVMNSLDPSTSKPLLTSMWGRTSLGELYADAYLDVYGKDKTKQHLIRLFKNPDNEKVDTRAKNLVLTLANKLDSTNRRALKHFYGHEYIFPRYFASNKNAALYGYSERLYYSERETQLAPGDTLPYLKESEIEIRQFPYDNASQGTPTWVDAFVVPKGKLAKNFESIATFIKFIQTDSAYLALTEPAPSFAYSYLLPAKTSIYLNKQFSSKQPLLNKFRLALDDSFIISSSEVWQGMVIAGSNIREDLKKL